MCLPSYLPTCATDAYCYGYCCYPRYSYYYYLYDIFPANSYYNSV